MNLTLLVDLDNTLLGNDMETFIPAYLGALGQHLEAFVPPEKMVATMIKATRCMFDNLNPNISLKACFDACFYSSLGLVEVEMREPFGRFYAEIFPALEALTQPRPEAVAFVEAAFERGYRVGIATNPAFPRTAILQRLVWAGLSSQEYPFELIPSCETFHFAKPDPAFFAEFLGCLGWPEGSVLVVGNDLEHDIRGGQGMGLPVYWVTDGQRSFPAGYSPSNGSGRLDEVLPWIDSRPAQALGPDFTSPSAIKAILRGSLAALNTLFSQVSLQDWSQRPHEEEWSLAEIACHLRDVEREVNLPRLRKIIQQSNPFIPGVDSDAWAGERGYCHQDGPQAFADFASARLETLEILEQVDGSAWDKPARHAIFGPTHLLEITRIMASHEQVHGRQIYQGIAGLAMA